MASSNIKQLEEQASKAQKSLAKAKQDLKRARQAQSKKEALERAKWMVVFGEISLESFIKDGYDLDVLLKNMKKLPPSKKLELVREGLKKERLKVQGACNNE